MSQQLVSHNPDLKRLRDDGYSVRIKSNHLVLDGIPYVNAAKELKFGTLISVLNLSGERTIRPSDHVVYFIGDHPCNKAGVEIPQIKHTTNNQSLGEGLDINHSFSNKPDAGYDDYHHKMSTYATIISGPAEAIDPTVTARAFPVIVDDDDESVFQYLDTSSSRAGIGAVSDKLRPLKIAIIGLGGTGSYVLDLVAKTPVQAIHIFDADRFSSHNAFRSPGAASVDELNARPQKVQYLKERYSKMHKNIVANDCFINASNVERLTEMDFVFLCLDRAEEKHAIIERLEAASVPFVDVGMGVDLTDDMIGGTLRVTTSTAQKRGHLPSRVPLSDGVGNNEYTQNIQIADLNALNAALAVIKWKKVFGFYRDFENEHHTLYTIDGNKLDNGDHR